MWNCRNNWESGGIRLKMCKIVENPRKLCKIPEQEAKAQKKTEKWVKSQNKVQKRGKSFKMCKIAGQNARHNVKFASPSWRASRTQTCLTNPQYHFRQCWINSRLRVNASQLAFAQVCETHPFLNRQLCWGGTQLWVGYGCAARSFNHHPITKPEKTQICNL